MIGVVAHGETASAMPPPFPGIFKTCRKNKKKV